MTVNATTSRADFTGNGVTTAFTCNFRILDPSHVIVYRTQISTGVVTTLALTTDYTVSGTGGTSFVVTTVATPTSDQRISVLRNVPLTQVSAYSIADVFPSTTTEAGLDKLTMLAQQLSEVQGRSLTLPPVTAGVSTSLPAPVGNTVLGWNPAGTALVNLTPQTSSYAVAQTGVNNSAVVPAGSTAQRDASPLAGYFRYNSSLNSFEGYNGSAWGAVGGGGATGGGTDQALYENDVLFTQSYTVGQGAQQSCTISIASPAVITQANGYVANQPVRFTTTGALPTGLSSNAQYYVSATGLSASSFQVSATPGGASINTSGSQSGAQTCGKIKNAHMVGPLNVVSGQSYSVPTGSRLVVA
jgi:hypothetical protein